MQKIARKWESENAAGASARQSAVVRHATQPQRTAGLLLNLQRTHGNSFVQHLLNGPVLQRKPRGAGSGPTTDTDYAFDTYQITELNLADPDIIARFNALSTPQLEDYRRRVKDLAVIQYISSLIESRPPEYTPERPDGKTTFKLGDLNVVILPDYYTLKPLPQGDSATGTKLVIDFTAEYTADGKITDGKADVIMEIQTVYGPGATAQSTSGYGVGTRKTDKEKSTTSLGFHESAHSHTVLEYIKKNPPPVFKVPNGITEDEFRAAATIFHEQWRAYDARMKEDSVYLVDCVGKWADFCPGIGP